MGRAAVCIWWLINLLRGAGVCPCWSKARRTRKALHTDFGLGEAEIVTVNQARESAHKSAKRVAQDQEKASTKALFSTTTPLNKIIRNAFAMVPSPQYTPHAFRTTLITMGSYLPIPKQRKEDLIKKVAG